MYRDLSRSININSPLIGAPVSALRTPPAALQSAPTAAQPAPSQPTPIVSNSPAHQEADQRVQVLEQELNQQRLLVEQERQARADLEQHLNQERQARIAAEESLRHERAQGTSRCMMPLVPISLVLSTETGCLALAITSTVMRLFVRCLPQPDPIEIQCHASDSVGHIKASLAHRLSCSISSLRLVFGGRELDQDFQPLTEIGINNESSLSAILSPGSSIDLSLYLSLLSLSQSLDINS